MLLRSVDMLVCFASQLDMLVCVAPVGVCCSTVLTCWCVLLQLVCVTPVGVCCSSWCLLLHSVACWCMLLHSVDMLMCVAPLSKGYGVTHCCSMFTV